MPLPRKLLHSQFYSILFFASSTLISLSSLIQINNSRPETMNIDNHSQQEVAPVSDVFSREALALMLPPIIRNQISLSTVPQTTLNQSLQPIINALESLNAELLLDLESAEHGPRVAEG
jgi:hypothetical protein